MSSHTFQHHDNKRLVAAIIVALLVLTVLPFARTAGYPFVYLDDDHYLTKNPRIQQGLTVDNVVWAFTTFEQSHWNPLTWLSHLAVSSLFGMQAGAFHAVNVALHAGSTTILFLALLRMTGAVWPSAFVAALFGIHPLHVESVAWVTERKDVLSGFFFMLMLLSYERAVRVPSRTHASLVFLWLALGLLSKSMLVTAPFVLLLLDVWPLGRSGFAAPADGTDRRPEGWGRLIGEKLPLFALSAAVSAIAYIAAHVRGAALPSLAALSLQDRLANAAVSYVSYLGKMVWPAQLVPFYPHPGSGLPAGTVAASSILLVVITGAAAAALFRRPALTVGWFWYLGMLVPVIGVVQVGAQAMADRYTYLSLIGVWIMLAWTASDAASRHAGARMPIAATAAAIVLALAAAAWQQVGYWKDSVTLFRHAVAASADNWFAENNLAVALSAQGKDEEAIGHLREAVRIRPDYGDAWFNLGCGLARTGRHDEALSAYANALRSGYTAFDVQTNLGISLAMLQRHGEAVAHFQEAVRLRPGSAQARYHHGIALVDAGRRDEAIAAFRQALVLQPAFGPARESLQRLTTGGADKGARR